RRSSRRHGSAGSVECRCRRDQWALSVVIRKSHSTADPCNTRWFGSYDRGRIRQPEEILYSALERTHSTGHTRNTAWDIQRYSAGRSTAVRQATTHIAAPLTPGTVDTKTSDCPSSLGFCFGS